MEAAQKQLASFIARFDPKLAKLARAAIASQRKAYPHANVLVYDNFQALVVGFARNEKATSVIFSIAIYAKWINLFFWNGASLDDPKGLLIGEGNQVRHVKLDDVALFKKRDFVALMKQALKLAGPFDETQKGKLIIKAIAKRQRARRS
jgi:hypothetical protein